MPQTERPRRRFSRLATLIAGAIALTAWVPLSPANAQDGTEDVSIFAGTGTSGDTGDNGMAINATFSLPSNIAVGSDGSVYIGDSSFEKIRRVKDGVITTVVGETRTTGLNQSAISASVDAVSIAVGPLDGLLYFADPVQNRIWFVDSSGILRLFAGAGPAGFSGDGGQASSALLAAPTAIAFASDGTLYISDSDNERVRSVDTGGVIRTVAGNGVAGSSGDGGQAVNAQFDFPGALAVDWYGRVYVSDTANHRVRSWGSDGIIETVLGNGSFDAPTPATGGTAGDSVSIDDVAEMSFDGSNVLHVATLSTIVRLDRNGLATAPFTTVDGTDFATASNSLAGVLSGFSFDNLGNAYVATNTSFGGDELQDLVYLIEAPANCRQAPVAAEWNTHDATRASVYRLYCAYFLRFPDHGGYDYWYGEFASETISLTGISDFFGASDEFNQTYGSLSNEDFLDLLYGNIMQRAADPGGRAYWLDILDTGVLSKGGVVLQFSDSQEFRNKTGTP